jgi:hypothetical protein
MFRVRFFKRPTGDSEDMNFKMSLASRIKGFFFVAGGTALNAAVFEGLGFTD